jgi:hypothetical protein
VSSGRILSAAVALGCALGGSSDVWAQSPGAGRPFGGLFGGRAGGTDRQNLQLNATLVQAYDDISHPEPAGDEPGRTTLGGYFAVLQTDADYAWKGRTAQLAAQAGSAWRYFGQLGEVDALSHTAAVDLSISLARRTTVRLSQSASYSPSYLFKLFAVADAPTPESGPLAPDYAVDDTASFVRTTSASVSRHLTRRGALSAAVDYAATDFQRHTVSTTDHTTYGARAGFDRTVGRRSGFRLGYLYRNADFGAADAQRTVEHGLQGGVGHTRVLSATRSATFSFNVGLSAADAQGTLPAEQGEGTLYRATSDAGASYQFARAWALRGAYRRSFEYLPELREPIFTSGITGAVNGLLSRRVDLQIAGGYSSGEAAVLGTSSFTTYTANLRSRLAVTQALALYLQYVYYFYEFGGEALLAPRLSPRLERHGVRVGLTAWLPVFKR